MEAKEYIDSIKCSYNIFRKKKLLLEDVNGPESLRHLVDEVLEQIFYEERQHDTFYREHGYIPVVEKEFNNLCDYYYSVLNFFNLYKQLKNY